MPGKVAPAVAEARLLPDLPDGEWLRAAIPLSRPWPGAGRARPVYSRDVPETAIEDSDRPLAASAARGDAEAFDELVRRHQPRLLRLAGRFFRRPEVVEEVVQETFLKAFLSLGGFRGDRPFGHWLTRIAVNASHDQLRRQRARPETAVDDAAVLDLLASPAGGESELARITAGQLLARLSPEERLVLTLTVLEELPVKDVAQLTGWSIPNVKVRAFRARAKLRRALGGDS